MKSIVIKIISVTLILAGCISCKDNNTETKDSVFELKQNETDVLGQTFYDFPDKGLVDENGEPISFDDYRGDKLFITFIYTSCPMKKMCPLLTQKTAKVQSKVKDDAHFVVFTFDPKTDTPQKLKEYGKTRGINFNGADFITGNIKTLDKLMERFEIAAGKKKDGKISHNMRVYMVNSEGTIETALTTSQWPIDVATQRLKSLK